MSSFCATPALACRLLYAGGWAWLRLTRPCPGPLGSGRFCVCSSGGLLIEEARPRRLKAGGRQPRFLTCWLLYFGRHMFAMKISEADVSGTYLVILSQSHTVQIAGMLLLGHFFKGRGCGKYPAQVKCARTVEGFWEPFCATHATTATAV